MTSEMIMIVAVPDRIIGSPLPLNASSSVIPRTEPGTMYGNIAMVSIKLVSGLFLLTERYAMNMPSTTIIASAMMQYK